MEKQAVLFLKKKNQKNFCSASHGCGSVPVTSKNKSFFCFFFVHKKEDSSL